MAGAGGIGSALSGLGGMMGNKNDDARDVQGAQRAVGGQAGLANPPPPVENQKKKSLLIGINYVGSKHALAGCQQVRTTSRT